MRTLIDRNFEIFNRRNRGESAVELAKVFGISPQRIGEICDDFIMNSAGSKEMALFFSAFIDDDILVRQAIRSLKRIDVYNLSDLVNIHIRDLAEMTGIGPVRMYVIVRAKVELDILKEKRRNKND